MIEHPHGVAGPLHDEPGEPSEQRGFPEPAESGAERIFFCLTNLAIHRRIECGPFSIWPLDDPHGLVSKLPTHYARTVRSACGQYELARKGDSDFHQEGEVFALLLSFASRRDVNIVNAVRYRSDGTRWQRVLPVAPNPTPWGADQGSPWYLDDDALEQFLQRAFALMTGEFQEMRIQDQPRGLRLALYALNSSRGREFSEMKYLKAWLALETLVQHSHESREVLPIDGKSFGKVRAAVQTAVKKATKVEDITKEQRAAVYDKIGELNRESIRTVAMRYFQRIFEKYPQQTVEEYDIKRFIAIRNRITHGAAMRDELADELGVTPEALTRTVNDEYERLTRLLERVILASLGIDNRWMQFRWELVGIGQ